MEVLNRWHACVHLGDAKRFIELTMSCSCGRTRKTEAGRG